MASTSVTNPATVQLCEADIANALLTRSFSALSFVLSGNFTNADKDWLHRHETFDV